MMLYFFSLSINFTINTELKHTSKCSRILEEKNVNEKEKNEILWIFAVRYGDFVGNWNEHQVATKKWNAFGRKMYGRFNTQQDKVNSWFNYSLIRSTR